MSLSEKQMDDLADKIATKVADRPCPLGLTHEEAPKLKGIVRFRDIALTSAIRTIVGILVTAVAGWLAIGFVQNLLAGS